MHVFFFALIVLSVFDFCSDKYIMMLQTGIKNPVEKGLQCEPGADSSVTIMSRF